MNKEEEINDRINQLKLELEVIDSSHDSRNLEQFLAVQELKNQFINQCVEDIKELNK